MTQFFFCFVILKQGFALAPSGGFQLLSQDV